MKTPKYPDDLKPIPEFADVIPINQWLEGVRTHCFIDYDGHGYWATKTHEFRKSASEELFTSSMVCPSDITKKKIKPPAWATHVSWYNK